MRQMSRANDGKRRAFQKHCVLKQNERLTNRIFCAKMNEKRAPSPIELARGATECFNMKQSGGAYGFCDCNVPVCRGGADLPCARLHTGIRASGGLCGVCCDGAASWMHGESAGSCVSRGGAGVAARGADPLHHRRTDGNVADERNNRVLHVLRRAPSERASA